MTERPRPRYGEGRDALIQAAVRVAGKQGVRRLTYRAVAAEAQVTHGTVQHHFGTLDALLEAALDYCVELSIRSTLRTLRSDDVSDFVADLPDAIRSTLDAQAYQYELILESRRRPALRPYVAKYYASYHAAVAQALEQLHLPADRPTVDLVFSALDGLVFRSVALGAERVEDLEDPLRVLRQTLRSLQEHRSVPGH
jgi:AcrR family transcriptional regulator